MGSYLSEVARTLRDAEIAFLLESLPFVRAVHVLDPPSSEFDYIAVLDRLAGAAVAQAHFRLVSGVGQERAARVWLLPDDPLSAPRALERAIRIELDANERALAARSVAVHQEQLRMERGRRFGRLLAETVAWCSSPVSASHRLRTPVLRPPLLEWRDPRLSRKSADWWRLTMAGAEAQEREVVMRRSATHEVGELAAKRATLLDEQGLSPAPSTDLRGGRLLLFRTWVPPDRTSAARAIAASPAASPGTTSEGGSAFLDGHDLPPWDTWMSWEPWVQGDEALVCWVPPDWLLRAEAACALRRPRVEWLREEFFDSVEGPTGAAVMDVR
jgi:hypothetical protein